MAGKTMGNLQKQWGWFFALGLLMMFFGFIIIMYPVAGTFTIELLLGLILLIGGLAHMALSFQAKKWGGFLLTLLSGIVYAVAGLLLLLYPLAGVITLTMFLGVLLLVTGILKGGLAFKIRPSSSGNWLLFDSIITILLGILILISWPSDAIWVIGLLFGIDMIFGGLSSIMLGFSIKEGN